MKGGSTQRLATGDIIAANWSADGKRVLFVRRRIPAIESVPAEGGTAVEVFWAPKDQVIVDAIELPDRSVLFTMMPPGSAPGPTTEIELWKAETDQTGRVREHPRRLTQGAAGASHLNHLSASASGRRVAFVSTSYQTDVYVADGDIRGGVINRPRRFTLSDRDDTAWQWAPDSRSIVLSSTRNGSADIFRQPLDSEVAEPLVTGPGQQSYAGVTGDARWLLYMSGPITGDDTVMRVLMGGGAPAEVVRLVGFQRLQCAVRGRCVLIESKDDSLVISSLDPVKGRGRELARMPSDTSGIRILPDGNAFSYILPTENGVRNRVRVISFNGKPATDVAVKAATRLSGLSWLPSGSGFLTRDGPPFRGRLLLVSPNGASKVLWAPAPPLAPEWGLPSPDEKHLLINALSRHSNVWMISDF
jgi:dipeptidyl aminopeptidase/acylaminoacyl peptidase